MKIGDDGWGWSYLLFRSFFFKSGTSSWWCLLFHLLFKSFYLLFFFFKRLIPFISSRRTTETVNKMENWGIEEEDIRLLGRKDSWTWSSNGSLIWFSSCCWFCSISFRFFGCWCWMRTWVTCRICICLLMMGSCNRLRSRFWYFLNWFCYNFTCKDFNCRFNLLSDFPKMESEHILEFGNLDFWFFDRKTQRGIMEATVWHITTKRQDLLKDMVGKVK